MLLSADGLMVLLYLICCCRWMQRSRKGAGFQKQPVPYLYGTNAFDTPRVELAG